MAVADGAGSAPRAAEGSTCAVETAVTLVHDHLIGKPFPDTVEAWEGFLTIVFCEVREALEQLTTASTRGARGAGAMQGMLRELATTLLVAVFTAKWCAIAQVGDGAVVVRRSDLKFETITTPDHGEYVNQTSFLTDANYLAEIQYAIGRADDVAGAALFTDGIERLALVTATNEAFAPFFRPLFTFADQPDADGEEIERFLYSDQVCERTDDDKTLVLAIRVGPTG